MQFLYLFTNLFIFYFLFFFTFVVFYIFIFLTFFAFYIQILKLKVNFSIFNLNHLKELHARGYCMGSQSWWDVVALDWELDCFMVQMNLTRFTWSKNCPQSLDWLNGFEIDKTCSDWPMVAVLAITFWVGQARLGLLGPNSVTSYLACVIFFLPNIYMG